MNNMNNMNGINGINGMNNMNTINSMNSMNRELDIDMASPPASENTPSKTQSPVVWTSSYAFDESPQPQLKTRSSRFFPSPQMDSTSRDVAYSPSVFNNRRFSPVSRHNSMLSFDPILPSPNSKAKTTTTTTKTTTSTITATTTNSNPNLNPNTNTNTNTNTSMNANTNTNINVTATPTYSNYYNVLNSQHIPSSHSLQLQPNNTNYSSYSSTPLNNNINNLNNLNNMNNPNNTTFQQLPNLSSLNLINSNFPILNPLRSSFDLDDSNLELNDLSDFNDLSFLLDSHSPSPCPSPSTKKSKNLKPPKVSPIKLSNSTPSKEIIPDSKQIHLTQSPPLLQNQHQHQLPASSPLASPLPSPTSSSSTSPASSHIPSPSLPPANLFDDTPPSRSSYNTNSRISHFVNHIITKHDLIYRSFGVTIDPVLPHLTDAILHTVFSPFGHIESVSETLSVTSSSSSLSPSKSTIASSEFKLVMSMSQSQLTAINLNDRKLKLHYTDRSNKQIEITLSIKLLNESKTLSDLLALEQIKENSLTPNESFISNSTFSLSNQLIKNNKLDVSWYPEGFSSTFHRRGINNFMFVRELQSKMIINKTRISNGSLIELGEFRISLPIDEMTTSSSSLANEAQSSKKSYLVNIDLRDLDGKSIQSDSIQTLNKQKFQKRLSVTSPTSTSSPTSSNSHSHTSYTSRGRYKKRPSRGRQRTSRTVHTS